MKKKLLISSAAVIVLIAAGAVWLKAAPTAPKIGPISVAPTSIEVGTSSAVTITAAISDPSAIPTGVNLVKVGPPSTVVGQFRDDGTNGDAVANDKVFTIRASMPGQAVGEYQYQVSAAFKGVLTRATAPVTITVAPKGVVLPPDPGEAGKATLEGIDSDHDGVRDDVQPARVNNFETAGMGI